MSKHLVLVLTEPTEGNEEAFNEYYEHTHLDEVLASAGYDTAQRFKGCQHRICDRQQGNDGKKCLVGQSCCR